MLDFALVSGRALRAAVVSLMLSSGLVACNDSDGDSGEPSPTPSATATPTASATPSGAPTATPTATATATPTATPSSGVTPTPGPTTTPTPNGQPTATPSATPSGSPTATPTATPTVTATPTSAPTSAPTIAPTPTPLPAPALSFVPPGESLDLPNYTLTAQYDLPVGTGANKLAAETSAVTYNRDNGNLFIIGDEGTAVVEVTRTGTLVGSMQFATALDDPEGIAWVDGNQFVVSEERIRTIKRFAYADGTVLAAGGISSVTIGTTIDNIGLEGISYDPLTEGYALVKEKDPLGLFLTDIDFGAGTASNGSATTSDSLNLFDPALAGVTDFSDIYVLANTLPPLAQDVEDLLVVGQENGVLLKMDRSGNILSRLNIGIPAQHEGVAADENNVIYLANELGGGNGKPQLWVYEPTTSPTAVGIGSRLFLTFSVNVAANTGNITLSNGAGDTRTVAIGDTTQITFSGRTVTIDLATDLVPGSTYSVSGPAGLIRAVSGGGRSRAISGAFQTRGDSLAPKLLSTVPADNAGGIVSSRVALTFNENIRAGTGNIVISDGKSDTRTIPVGDTTQVTITGATVEINPTVALNSLTAYNVQMVAGVIEDTSGNDYAGLTTATAFNFTTAAIGGAPPTTLHAGDLLFMGINGDPTDAIAFVLLVDVTAGTQINFTDKDYSATTPNWPSNESVYTWTADVDYDAGTIVTIQTDPLVSDLGSVNGVAGGVGTGSETYYAFQGTIANAGTGDITVDRFLALIYIGTGLSGAYPQEIIDADADVYLGTEDNWKYGGSLDRTNLNAFAALVRDTASWGSNDTTAYPLPGGSMFGTVPPTTGTVLDAGDLLFMGLNSSGSATEAFAFVLLKDVEATTKIQFTDKNYTNGATTFPTNEGAFTWTADVDYPAGTIVTIQPSVSPIATDLGTVSGAGGGVGGSETYYAFQGTIANAATGDITVDRFLASISINGGESDIPATLTTANAALSLTGNNVRYAGSLDRHNPAALASLATAVRVTSNWQSSSSALPFSAGHLFGGSDLSEGGVLFMAANSDNNAPNNDAFAFVLTEAIVAGTEIGFTDKDYVNGAAFPLNEAGFIWTADVAYPAGTIVTVRADAFAVDKGTLYGVGGGLGNGETYYAFKGQVINPDAGGLIVYRFLAALHVASATANGDISAAVTSAGAALSFALDNAKYNGSLDQTDFAAFVARIKDPAQWVSDDTVLYPLTGGSFFPSG